MPMPLVVMPSPYISFRGFLFYMLSTVSNSKQEIQRANALQHKRTSATCISVPFETQARHAAARVCVKNKHVKWKESKQMNAYM